MYPASRRSRALEWYLLAAVTVTSACASTGPDTAPAPAVGPNAQSMSDSPIPGTSSPIPGTASPLPAGDSPRPRAASSYKPRTTSAKSRPEARKPRTESTKPKAETVQPKAEPAQPKVVAAAKPKVEPVKPQERTSKRRPVRIAPRTRADSMALETRFTKQLAHRPLALALAKRMRKPELADRVASAIVYEAGRNQLSPSLLAGVLLIENTPFDTSAVSTEGAIGLMQVMPMHVGSYGCLSGDLLSVEDNICHGARLLRSYIRRAKSTEDGLRRYNGCLRGRNTPRCYRYPGRVLRTASMIRRDVLIAAAKLSNEAADSAAIESARLGADLPTEVETSDSVEAAAEAADCASLLGCLKHRWTR
jgi:soluble lytic murein transglycosylase-like protein